MQYDIDQHRVAPGEFSEEAIVGHPCLERSAPEPCHRFDWPLLFQLLDGELPPDTSRERMARAVNEVLCGLIAPPRDAYAIGLRSVGFAIALGMEDELPKRLVRTYRQRVATAKWRARQKAGA
jgi:hypothetical protein